MQATIDFILEKFVESLDRQINKSIKNTKDKTLVKIPKTSQHVMVSRTALETILVALENRTISYEYNFCQYLYQVRYEFYGFKCWKVWFERIS